MGDWPLVGGSTYADTIGEDTAVSSGLRVVTNLNAKGSWAEATAATAQDTDWLLFKVVALNGVAVDYLFDIGIGAAGSERVIVANIPAAMRSGRVDGSYLLIPLHIPAGTRVAVRGQSSSASEGRVVVTLLAGGFTQSSPLGLAETYGANTANSGGTSVDPGGVANTKGAWTELTASLTRDARWLVLAFGNQANSARTACVWLIDIGVGAAGSEQVIVPNLSLASGGTAATITPLYMSLPIGLPAGVRVAMRAQCDITDATDRTFDAILLGVS